MTFVRSSELAQGDGETAIGQLAPSELIATGRQVDASLESAMGQLEAVDRAGAARQRQRALTTHAEHAAFYQYFDIFWTDAGERYLDPELAVALEHIDR